MVDLSKQSSGTTKGCSVISCIGASVLEGSISFKACSDFCSGMDGATGYFSSSFTVTLFAKTLVSPVTWNE